MIADPTGISSMVYAFAKYGSCSVEDLAPSVTQLDFGPGPAANKTRTFEITVENPTTITEITTSPFQGCYIQPKADCIGKALQPGQKCNVQVTVAGDKKLVGELRIYTTAYNVIPMGIGVTASDDAGQECPLVPNALEAVNLSSITGVWAWDNQQSQRVIVNDDGTVQAWNGPGTMILMDPIHKSYLLVLGSAPPQVITLSEDHDHLAVTGGAATTATRRPWDPHCNPGETFSAGLCYDVPVGYALTVPGFMGKPCPSNWRDDGVQCYPPWTGVKVPYQADSQGTLPMQRPVLVSDCSNYNQVNHQACPANFKATAVCTCEAIPTSKGLLSIIGKPAH
jgi:hypothetical protein